MDARAVVQAPQEGETVVIEVTDKAALIATLRVAIKDIERGAFNDAFKRLTDALVLCEGVDDDRDQDQDRSAADRD